jgi:hypothetical protein
MPEAIARATGGAHGDGLGEGVGVASVERDGEGEGVGRAATVELLHATAQTSNSAGHVPPLS